MASLMAGSTTALGTIHHRMISSARTKSDWGMVRPSALAVLRLITLDPNKLIRDSARREDRVEYHCVPDTKDPRGVKEK